MGDAMFANVVINENLILKYGGNGPRYTSYPTVDRFVEAFDASAYQHWLRMRPLAGGAQPLSLYVHLPCYGGEGDDHARDQIISRAWGGPSEYLCHLAKEMELVCAELGPERHVEQVHLCGGMPTFFANDELRQLKELIAANFKLNPVGEFAVEVDPRTVDAERIALLAGLGFNRIELGVQDFDPAVQRAVNRVQTAEETLEVTQAAREHGFRSVNFDLIYGLPAQTLAGFERTVDWVCSAAPDRIALHSYTHAPMTFKPLRRIEAADLPTPELKLRLFTRALEKFAAVGYHYIGMDHFAQPGDDLAIAQRQGRLKRNFQGYSSSGDVDTLGLGVAAVSSVGPAYSQNHKTFEQYAGCLEAGVLPVMRGIQANADDLARRAVIHSLVCYGRVSKEAISIAHLLDFDKYFAAELKDMATLQEDGLVESDAEWINVTPVGQLLTRSICGVFDRYFREGSARARYSRVM